MTAHDATPAVPGIDSEVGLLRYSTRFPGCGGRIRESRGDFEVAEILSPQAESSISETGGYPVYLLTKSGIDTAHALSGLLKKTGLRLRSLGLKDANATTTQYVYSAAKTRGVEGFETGRYSLKRLGYTERPLSKRQMIGNRFSVRVSGASPAISEFGEDQRILNFYGYQRFGSARPVTHLIGRSLVQGRYREAVDYILSFTSEHDSEENTLLRRELACPSNLEKTYGRIPPQMDIERRVVSALIRHGDALSAIRALPVDLRRFYVNAYQSYLFNLTLCSALDYGEDLYAPGDGDVCYDGAGVLGRYSGDPGQRLAIPMVGYSYYKKTRFHFHIARILGEQGISPRDFYMKGMQEASGEGGFRGAAIRVDGFAVRGDRVSFTLSRGSFATMVLREMIKPRDPLSSGF